MTSETDGILNLLTLNKDINEVLLRSVTDSHKTARGYPLEKLTLAMNYWLNVPMEKLEAINDIMKIANHYRLLVAAVPNTVTLRAGIATSYTTFDVDDIINTSIRAILMNIDQVLALNKPEALSVLIEHLLQVTGGQDTEVDWRDNNICPYEDDYRHMVVEKLGALFKMDARLKRMFSDCKQDFSTLAELLAVYFQIRDDYGSLFMEEFHDQKGYAEDLPEGKFIYPMIYPIRKEPEEQEIRDILSQMTRNPETKQRGLSLLHKSGALTYTRDVLEDFNQKIRDEVERLGGNPLLIELLDESLDWREF